MKKVLILFFLLPLLVFSQGVRNTGGIIKITTDSYVYINGGGYLNESNGTNHGTIDSDGTIILTGDWTNNTTDITNKVFTSLNENGTVSFINGNFQNINGTNPTNFENLVINKTIATIVQLSNSEINGYTTVGNGTRGICTLTQGILKLNSKKLIINNTSPAALTYVLGNGYVVSETYDAGSGIGSATPQNPCNSKIQWNIGTTTGNYVFPFFTLAGTNVSLIYNNVGGAGIGAGNVTVSTYHTNNANYPYATDGSSPVLHMAGYFIPDNSPNAVDRFHVVVISGYATKPTANITIYYDDINDLNLIPETNLQAQRWTWIDATNGSWSNLPVGAVNVANNYVSGIPTNNAVPCNIWVLSNNINPLPIQLLSFDGKCDGEYNTLYWNTATETNCDFFTIEKSENIENWTVVTVIKGAGNSNTLHNYIAYDHSPFIITYYRLKQTDYDGKYTYSEPISINCNNYGNFKVLNLYQNKNSLIVDIDNPDGIKYEIWLTDMIGRKMTYGKYDNGKGYNQININVCNLISGCYAMILYNGNETIVKKIIIKQ